MQTERDVSVRQRAIDLLYAMCDRTNATTIVGELLNYLEKADYSIREELVCIVIMHLSHVCDFLYGYIIKLELIQCIPRVQYQILTCNSSRHTMSADDDYLPFSISC